MTEYAIKVRFIRDLLADADEVLSRAGQVPTPDFDGSTVSDQELMDQLAAELQEAIEAYGLPAGSFEIIGIERNWPDGGTNVES